MTRLLSCTLLLSTHLAAAGPTGEVMAELPPPLRARVWRHTAVAPAGCGEAARPPCPARASCVFVELPGAEAPRLSPDAPDLCDRPDVLTPLRRRLEPGPPGPVEAQVDPSGTRLAVRVGAGPWTLFYLLDGRLLAQADEAHLAALKDVPEAERTVQARPSTPGAPLDWRDWKTLEEAAGLVLRLTLLHPARTREALFAHLRRTLGDEALGRLWGQMDVRAIDWAPLRDTLDARGQAAVRAGLHARFRALMTGLRSGAISLGPPGTDVLAWLTSHREDQPAGYADALVGELNRQALHAAQPDSTLLGELLALGEPRAGPLACQLLGVDLSTRLLGDALDPGGLDERHLVAIARTRTPCPWVGVALSRQACDPGLRCARAGTAWPPQEPADPEAWHPPFEAALSAPQRLPLCSRATVEQWAARWTPRALVPDEHPQALLLAAAYAQGRLPDEVVARNARRGWAFEVTRPAVAPADEASRPAHACAFLPVRPEELLCALPLEVRRFTRAGCQVDLDAARRVARFQELPVAGAAPR